MVVSGEWVIIMHIMWPWRFLFVLCFLWDKHGKAHVDRASSTWMNHDVTWAWCWCANGPVHGSGGRGGECYVGFWWKTSDESFSLSINTQREFVMVFLSFLPFPYGLTIFPSTYGYNITQSPMWLTLTHLISDLSYLGHYSTSRQLSLGAVPCVPTYPFMDALA